MAKKLVLSMAAQEHAGFAFAAQLLSLDAPSSSHLKKETLSPWVVHAHHCGLDFRVGMPPPPTLAIARPPSTLRSVVDLADTIACLQERRPACLHLAFDAKIMVLWLHSPDKFLLYVCPAKVKVLKSLQEVVAKMTEDVDSDEPCTLRLLVSTNNQTNASPSAEIPLPDTSPVPHQVPRLVSPCPTRLATSIETAPTAAPVEDSFSTALHVTNPPSSPVAKWSCSPSPHGQLASLSRSRSPPPAEALGTSVSEDRKSVGKLLFSALVLPDAPATPPSLTSRASPNQDCTTVSFSATPDKLASTKAAGDDISHTTLGENERIDSPGDIERHEPQVSLTLVRTLSPSKAASAYPLPNYKAKLGATTWALLELQAAALAANTTGVSDRRRQSSANLRAVASHLLSRKIGSLQHGIPSDVPPARASVFVENEVDESRETEPDLDLNDAALGTTAPLATPTTPPATPQNACRSTDAPVAFEASHYVAAAVRQDSTVEEEHFELPPHLGLCLDPSGEVRLEATPESVESMESLCIMPQQSTLDQSPGPSLTREAFGVLGSATHDVSESVSCDQPSSMFAFAAGGAIRATTVKKMTFQDVRALRQSLQSRREAPWPRVDRTDELATLLTLHDKKDTIASRPNDVEEVTAGGAPSLSQSSPGRNATASNLDGASAQHGTEVSELRTGPPIARGPPAVPPRRRRPPPVAADSPPPSPPPSPPKSPPPPSPPRCNSALTTSGVMYPTPISSDVAMASFVPHVSPARRSVLSFDTMAEVVASAALEAAPEQSIAPLADANLTSSSSEPRAIAPCLAPRQETVVREPTSVDLHFVGVEAPPTLDRSQRLAELRAEKIKAQRLRQLETRRLQIQARAPLDDPKVAASKPSNRQLIQNAIEYTLLAGVACEKERTKVLGVLATHPSENFVVALKGSALDSRKMTYRGLYVLDPTSGVVSRVLGSGPNTLDASSVMQFFRYNSGKKAFVGVSTRSFTVATDAAAVPDDCFRPLKAKRPSYL